MFMGVREMPPANEKFCACTKSHLRSCGVEWWLKAAYGSLWPS